MSVPINVSNRHRNTQPPDDDFYYVNIYWNNLTPAATIGSSVTTFTDPILSKGKDYWLTTIDFVLDGSYIPIFTFQDNTYYIVLTYGNYTSGPIPVVYQAYDVFPYNSGQETVYYYQHFVNMINVAFNNAFVALNAAIPGGLPGPVTVPPFMYYDPTSQTCPIYVQSTYIANNVSIFMNNILFNFFGNYPAVYYGENNANKQDYQIQVISYNELNAETVNSIPSIRVNQEFSSLYHWFDCVEIIVVSGTLGVRAEVVPTTIGTGTVYNNQQAGTGPATSTTIASFKPYWSDATGPHSWLYFTATGPFRPINITQDEIRTFDLQIYYRTKNGTIHSYWLPANESLQMKFMFMKRGSLIAGTKSTH
jgi:hypothetical protein